MIFEFNTTWRRTRLETAVGHFERIFGISHAQANRLIHRVRDDRGTLIVDWFNDPTVEQLRAFKIAWEIMGETEVSHHVAIIPTF